MSFQRIVIATLALLGSVLAADSCCFVVQDEAHEVYWSAWATDTYTAIVNSTSTKVVTTSSLVTDNPVSLYTNPAFAIPQMTEVLIDSTPTKTGGIVIASPTGFWVYHTAKVFVAPAVTDSEGNVVCGTVSSFTNVASSPAACVPTFTGVNSHAAAYFDNIEAKGVEISLTTPFVHVPTRADLHINPTEACVQGSGIENYGYPVQQLINHLADNEFYSAQYPGIASCIPAGPSIKAAKVLAVTIGLAATTETGGGGIGDDTTTTTSTESSSTSSTSVSTTSSSSSSSTSATTTPSSTTSLSSTPIPPALPDSTTSQIPGPGGPITETADPGGLEPDTPTSSSSTTTVPPIPQSAVTTSTSETSSGSFTESSTLSEIPSLTSSETSSEVASSSSQVTSEATPSSLVTVPSTIISTGDTLLSTGSIDSTIITSSSTEESAATTTTSLEITGGNTSEEPIPTSLGNATISESSPTSSGTGLTSATPIEALAMKQYVSWELLTGLMGLLILGAW